VRGHSLLDFGEGGRLERWSDVVLARPDSRAIGRRSLAAEAWNGAGATFEGRVGGDRAGGGGWRAHRPLPDRWPVDHAGLRFLVGCAPSGHTGLFPEQAASWVWLRDHVASGATVLNLFAYTGAATLVAGAAGASVVHVDGSRPTVAWARRNAALSGLAERPIRWIVDDAAAFVARELRRGRRYDGVVLDPPSYGHGAGGRSWRLEDDLLPLLDQVAELVGGPRGFVLLTAHTPGFWPDRLAEELAVSLGAPDAGIERGPLTLTARSGATLDLGAFARWPGKRS